MLSRNVLTLVSALTLGSASSWSQTTAAPNDVDPLKTDDEVLLMDPFTVTSESGGYKVVDTLGGSRVRTELADTAAALSVINTKLMQDLNVTDAQDLLVYTTNTDIAGVNGSFSGVATRGFGTSGEGARLVNPTAINRSRGLSAMDNARNYFQSQIPWDSFNISRVDISRGANSFLFGVGSPSGISNVSTNNAIFSNSGSVEAHYGSYSTTRGSLDYNRMLIDNELAVRVDLVDNRERYQQKPAFNDSKRIYTAVRFDPSFLNTESSHTKIEFNFENGEVDSNNPRTLPPMDYISGYFDAGTNKNGYNPFTYNPNSANVDPSGSLWVTNEDILYAWGSNATYWFDAATGQFMKAGQASLGGTRKSDGKYLPGFNVVNNSYNMYTTGFQHYAIAANYKDPTKYLGAYDRTVTYLDKTMTDTSAFDFYNKLLDGNNKREWQNWNAYNLSVVQSLFNYALNLQFVATHEEYRNGQEGALGTPYISVDMNAYNTAAYPTWFIDYSDDEKTIVEKDWSEKNPNVGRPFVAGTYNNGSESFYELDNYQFTAAYSLRFSDIMEESLLTRILGHQDFTGLLGHYITNQESRGFQQYRTDLAFAQDTNLGNQVGNSAINWVAYLGGSLAGRNSLAGANLSNLSTVITPTSGLVRMWDGTWTAGSDVDPTADWIDPVPNGDQLQKEIDNPRNYKGYRDYTATVINWRDSDQLYTSGDKKRQTLSSAAFLYQGYFWDDAIVPSVGIRRDRVRQQGTVAPKNDTTNVYSMNYDIEDAGAVMYTTSISYGVAAHMSKMFKGLMPNGHDVSFYYFHGNNQTPRVRYGLDGIALPNEEGTTDDFSVQYDGFDGRISMRVGYFKTVDKHAPLGYNNPLGGKSWLVDSLPCWTAGFAACVLAAAETPDAMQDDLKNNSWLYSGMSTHPDVAAKLKAAFQKDFVELFPQSYWDQYGIPVSVDAIKKGDWVHILTNGASPIPWNIANTHFIHGLSPIIDQNLESTGFELEATVKPLKNWDVTFNASKVEAKQTGLGESAATYLNGMAKLYLDSDMGLTPMWGNFDSPTRNEFMSGLWAPYLTQVALTGSQQPEVRKWNFKLISNYTFEEGVVKGLNFGGAFRWASKQVVGYGIKEGDVYGNKAWIYDVDSPIYGSSDSHFDMWIGYQRKLTEQVDWKVQLNLRNVGESTHLVTVAVEPDGTVAQQRIVSGMSWDLSMKFMF
jgi:hypothetical protein